MHPRVTASVAETTRSVLGLSVFSAPSKWVTCVCRWRDGPRLAVQRQLESAQLPDTRYSVFIINDDTTKTWKHEKKRWCGCYAKKKNKEASCLCTIVYVMIFIHTTTKYGEAAELHSGFSFRSHTIKTTTWFTLIYHRPVLPDARNTGMKYRPPAGRRQMSNLQMPIVTTTTPHYYSSEASCQVWCIIPGMR